MCCRGVIKKGLGQVVPGHEGGTQENRGQAEAAASQKQIQMSKRSRGVKLEQNVLEKEGVCAGNSL